MSPRGARRREGICSWYHRETFHPSFTDQETCRIHDNSFPSFMKRDIEILNRFTQISCGLRHDLFHGISRSSARRCATISCSLESSDTLTTNSIVPGRLPYLVYAAGHSCLASVDGSRWSSLTSSCLRSTSSLPQRASSTSSLWTLSSISKQQCSRKIDLFPLPTLLDSAEQRNSEDVSLSMPGRTSENVSVVTLAVGDGSRRNMQFLFLGNFDSPHRVFEFCIPVEDSMDVIVSFSVAV